LLIYPHRSLNNRAVVIQEGEMKYWKQLIVDSMSDKSDDPADSHTLVIHPLPWLSERKARIDVSHICLLTLCVIMPSISALYRAK